RSLHTLARDRIIVALHPLADLLAQLCQVFQPHRFGERIVDRRRQTLAHFLDLDLEHRILAGQIGRTVIRRERHVDGAVLAWLCTDELVLEARDEPSPTELDRNVLSLAAGNLDVASPANEME